MRPLVLAAATWLIPSSAPAQTRPAFAPPRIVSERGPSPTYYRLSPRVYHALLRLGLGMHARPTDTTRTSAVAFTAEVNAGIVRRVDRASPHGVFVEAGYSHTAFSQHLGLLGVGWIYGLGARTTPGDDPLPMGLRLAVIARAAVGSSYDRAASGMRHGVAVGYGSYAVEMAHQVLWVEGRGEHEFHLTLTSLLAFDEAS